MRDLVSNIGAVQVVGPQVLAGANTSAAVDLKSFNSGALVINTGAIVGAGDFGIKLQHSDETGGGTFEDVPAGELSGTIPATLEADKVYKVGYSGYKRYIRTVVSKAGGTSIALGAVLIKGNARDYPVA